MRRFPWRRGAAAILGSALVACIAAAALPDNEYQRFASLGNTIHQRIRWIYERINFDATPIDVAVLGPSRAGAAISAPRLQVRLAAAGLPLRAVNFALPENGRDLHWVIERQLLAKKAPRILVIAVIEKPSRFGHPAFKYVAPTAEIVDPAFAGNLNWPANLLYLPYRQLKLFTARLAPTTFGLPATFDPEGYAGTDYDNARTFTVGDLATSAKPPPNDPATLAAGVVRYERGVSPPIVGRGLADVEFGAERAYVARMAEAARARGIRVVFLFLPYYTGPSVIQERAFYERYGPVLDAGFAAGHPDWYFDVPHLNARGQAAVSDWLATQLAVILKEGKR